jgi:site-specific recombinase XerD
MEYIKLHNIGMNEKLFPITTRQFRRIWNNWRPNKSKGLHTLRHTFGTLLINNCDDIYAAKHLLGHRQIANTEKYLHFVHGQKDLRSKMKGMFKKKLGE